ncbi:N-acetylmuramidase domain-containing protein [Lysobacter koreensis]|uniref:N-acetylmuramidase domain-containing protein n=1 Tax=Lysobacter koreensis TaxID=266122 RepID=A0ABW2YRE7_9GAMM
MTDAARFYRVRAGDSLSRIAKRNNTTVTQLAKINGIKDVNRIGAGQLLALKPESVLRVDVQLLDRDRNPLPNAKVRLEHNGRILDRASGKDGRVPGVTTQQPDDVVKVWIQRADQTWKLMAQTTSDWGNKLVTLVSPKIRIEAKTYPHPQDGQGRPVAESKKPQRVSAAKAPDANPPNTKSGNVQGREPLNSPRATVATGDPQSLFSNVLAQLGIKSTAVTYQNGLPSYLITNDQSELEFLGGYTGAVVSEADYQAAAKKLNCEVAAIKAVAKVESGGKRSFDSKNRPVILFERHKFHKHTGGKFSEEYPWLSSKKGYSLANTKAKKALLKAERQAGTHSTGDFYGATSDTNYVRLAKAYLLDKDAALKSCSWGKFQVLGENAEWLGYRDVSEFVKLMAVSESEHLDSFVRFVKNNHAALKGVQTLDWAKFASAYNGKNYKAFNYDEKMRKAYEIYAKK